MTREDPGLVDRPGEDIRRLQRRLGERAESLRRLATHYSLLAGESRLKILAVLESAGELCVCDLATIIGLTPAAVSQHLSRLRSGNLVVARRDGMTVYYRRSATAEALPTGPLP
jgi:DNA-binding transcriptional ArsR family regulator